MSDRTSPLTTPAPSDDLFIAQCLRYIDGEMGSEAFAVFHAQLDADPRRQTQFVELSLLSEWIAESSANEHADGILAMAELYTRTRVMPGGLDAAKPPHLSTRDAFSLMGYLAMQGLRTKAGKIGSVAAVLALAAVLYLSIFGLGGTSNTQPTPAQDLVLSTPAKPEAQAPNYVATLWASTNARWASADYAIGDRLRSGTSMTLLAGHAEITTSRGARAILEAPATIELMDSPNALRLHYGRLVGICETDSSKGFLVRTPQLDVTDLGTRFGVDVSQAKTTEVHVLEGEVAVSVPGAVGVPRSTRRLTAGQAVVQHVGDALASVECDPPRFARSLEIARPQPLADSGPVAWHDQPPAGRIPESDALQVFLEAKGLTLTEDVVVDFNRDDAWPTQKEHGAYRVPAGTTVDVYLVHLDTPGDAPFRGDYLVRFDRPILGVIGSNDGFDQTDALVKASDALKNYVSRGVAPHQDKITISEDGRALNLSLHVAEAIDHVRVLVLSNKEPTP